jgi:hypothetical protein
MIVPFRSAGPGHAEWSGRREGCAGKYPHRGTIAGYFDSSIREGMGARRVYPASYQNTLISRMTTSMIPFLRRVEISMISVPILGPKMPT